MPSRARGRLRDAWRRSTGRWRRLARARKRLPGWASGRSARVAAGALCVALLALGLWLATGVGFVNYDTLYALVWGQQLARGETPQYDLPIAPTPHPLIALLGLASAPLPASAVTAVVVALAFVALAGCGWVLYRLGSLWFGKPAGVVAALVLLTRVPVLSYGVRAYVDVPYVLFVLAALLAETKRRRAGAPVLVPLALAGLLRPEAWAFSALYWLYLAYDAGRPAPRRLAGLALLAAAAPILWLASDLLVTGDPVWSLTNTKHTAHQLGRVTGLGNVPQYVPRRIGEVLRPAALVGAVLGGALSLLWLRNRARLGAIAGVVAVVVFPAMATFGLPIDTRYAFLAAAILCLFCGAGACGWVALRREDLAHGGLASGDLTSGGRAHGDLAGGDVGRDARRWRAWMVAGMLVLGGLLATLPGQLRSAHRELSNLERQQQIQDDLLALVHRKAIALRCGPVGVPNHAPVPLLALYLKAAPSKIVSAEAHPIERGVYVEPASVEVERSYVLDPKDPHLPVSIPPGFSEAHVNRSWLIFERCE
jgi:hypothetical protein